MMKDTVLTAGSLDLDEDRDLRFRPDVLQRELVARIVVSPSFARSERLSTLLRYVCDMTLKGREREINEQRIGEAVFGRSKDYDSAVDGIVRTQASRLRQRLDLYFEREGADEPLRLSIPRGRYIPVFEPRKIEPLPESVLAVPASARLTAEPVDGPSRAVPGASSGRALPWVLAGVLATVLAVVLAGVFARGQGGFSTVPGQSPMQHPLWSRMFSPDHRTLLVPGDSGLVLFEGMARRHTDLGDYLRGEYRTVQASTPRQEIESDFANRRYTSIVDLEIATTLTQLAIARRSGLDVRYARDVRPNDLKGGNVILVGAAEANPWVELFERNMNFVLRNNLETHVFSILNRSPRAGEPAQWDSAVDDTQRRVYGVVALVPNLSTGGKALLVEGTSMSGTEAAWDFLADDAQLLPFLERIRRADGTLPYFEVLLGSNNMGSSAVRCTLLAWRTDH